jgi:hypothetical protein
LVTGASSAAAIGSKTAIYSVKIGSALSRLAGILKSSAKKLWEMAKVVKTITKFTFGAFKKFTIGTSLPHSNIRNQGCGSGSSTEFSCFEVLDVLFKGLKASLVAWESFREA